MKGTTVPDNDKTVAELQAIIAIQSKQLTTMIEMMAAQQQQIGELQREVAEHHEFLSKFIASTGMAPAESVN